MLYGISRVLVRFALFFVFRLRVRGKSNIPAEGGVIIAYNHRSNWDPVIAALSCNRPLRFMAKKELFKNPVFGGLIKKLGAFPINRENSNVGAVKSALKILRAGDVLLMFPEGHRIKEGRTVKAKPGVAIISHMAKTPVIPANISGSYRWLCKITVTYGTPISLEKYYGDKIEPEKAQELADGILNAIKRMSA